MCLAHITVAQKTLRLKAEPGCKHNQEYSHVPLSQHRPPLAKELGIEYSTHRLVGNFTFES